MNESSQKRPVGPFALLALGVNGIVGVGIFFIPATLARSVLGGSSVILFGVTALALVPVALSFAALGKRFDEDGGPVVFARAAFGQWFSFVVGWVAFISAVSSAAAVMVGLVAFSGLPIAPGLPQKLAATLLVTVLALVCASGLRISAGVWTTLTVLKLIPLVLLVGAYFVWYRPWPEIAWTFEWNAWKSAALIAVFAYQGFEIVPVLAGQSRSSARNVPVATLGSLGFAALLYVCLQSACVAALPELAKSGSPLADAAAIYGGPWLASLVLAGTNVSSLGIAVGMVAATPHYLSTLAKGALGFSLADTDAKGVPQRALAVTWLLVTILIQLSDLKELFELSSVAVLAQYVVTAAALATLALRHERGLTLAHLWMAVPAAAVGLWLASGAKDKELAVAGVALLLGLMLRAISRRIDRSRATV